LRSILSLFNTPEPMAVAAAVEKDIPARVDYAVA
jgi:hypothetical protein